MLASISIAAYRQKGTGASPRRGPAPIQSINFLSFKAPEGGALQSIL